jgi:type I restriction enzyme S subunit
VKRLDELADIVMGQSPDSRYYNRTGKGVPLIQGNADIVDGRSIARVWTSKVSKEGLADDLLLTVRAPVGAIGRATERSCLGRGVCALRPRCNRDFLFHALRFSEASWKVLEQGSTFTAANSAQVAAFSIRLPSLVAEQAGIATLLSDMDAELVKLGQQLAKTRDIKQGMMQELLTGKTRLLSPQVSHA